MDHKKRHKNDNFRSEDITPEIEAELEKISKAAKSEAKSHVKADDQHDSKFEEEIENLKAELLRAFAETENIRKRYEKQIEDTAKYAITGFLKDLLPAIDNLYRASESIPEEKVRENELLQKIHEGLIVTQKSFIDIFAKHGLNRVFPQRAEKFDHNLHQAVATIADPTLEAGLIVNCMQAGYELAGRLIRPAIVSVSKKE